MKIKKLKVTKANDLIMAKYSRGLIETRIVDACIAQIDMEKDLTPERIFELKAADLFDLYDMDSIEPVYTQLKVAAKNLIDQVLYIRGEGKWINWFSFVQAPDNEGRILVQFSVAIKPYLFAIEGNFTSYTQQHTLQFKTKYSHRIYEFIRQWLSFGNKDFSIEELKDRLNLSDEYQRLDDLQKRVIDPAIEEINTYSDLWVKYSKKKTGRKITHLSFLFGLKEVEKTTKPKPTRIKQLIPDFKGHPEYKVDAAEAASVLAAHEEIKKKPEAKPKKEVNDADKQRLAGLKKATKGI